MRLLSFPSAFFVMNETCIEIVEKLQKLGCDNVIATASSSLRRQIKFANNKIARTSAEESSSIHLFASIGKKTVETLVDAKEKNLDKRLAELVALAKKLPDNPEFQGIASGKYTYPKINCFDAKISQSGEECVEILEQALETCKNVKAGGMFETNESSEFLYSSQGPSATSKGTGAYFSIRCLAEQNASGHKVIADTHLANINPVQLAVEASQLAIKAKNPVQGTEGTYNLVLDAFPFACLLDPFSHSASAFSVESGLSPLGGKINKKIASDAFTLYDDPTQADAFHATPFDSEGLPTKRTAIVENGILKTYLHNTSTAKKYGVASTGHAGLSSPHPWNPAVQKGKASLDELINEVKNGIYVTNVWYTRFQNYSTGDFSTIPRDAIMQIENGELTKPLRGIRISDNLLNLLSNISMLSSNQCQIYGWEVETPIFSCDALIEKVKITTPQG